MRGYICNIKVKLEYDLESLDCDYLLKKVLFRHWSYFLKQIYTYSFI